MSKKKKVLFICTENACQSQIAHGLLNELSNSNFEVISAGSHPSQVYPISIVVMEEIGIDISKHTSNYIDNPFRNSNFDLNQLSFFRETR